MRQDEALQILKTGANVFLTGEPGSGKTHTVNRYVAYLREHGIEPAITASTGIAATHIGGMTIHAWSGVGIKSSLSPYDLDRIVSNEYIAKRIARTKVLVIDEISMLAPELLDSVDAVCRGVKRSGEAFGGMQVVLVGDFFQLPPIVSQAIRDDDYQASFLEQSSARFAYESGTWQRAQPVVCYLVEQYRQDDIRFLELLSAIRRNTFGHSHRSLLITRKATENVSADIVKLFSHNFDVDRMNDVRLAELDSEERVFDMASRGNETLVRNLKKGCLSPERLSLKIGAAVMCTKNNPREGFVNGTLGTIVDFDEESGNPLVETRDGRILEIAPMEWTIEGEGAVRASITQIPLRLAWAITVHKSQGMSLDEAVMDLSNVFEFGQGYVALSRLRRLSGLHLLGWNERALAVDPAIIVQDEVFRDASRLAVEAFGRLGAELATMHERFIEASGGKIVPPGTSKPHQSTKVSTTDGFAEIRKAHPKAYRRWEVVEDEQLRELFVAKRPIAELAEIFGRKRGAIHSRLVKLGLLSPIERL
jgi:ATP-dependent DNA helicase PIF1